MFPRPSALWGTGSSAKGAEHDSLTKAVRRPAGPGAGRAVWAPVAQRPTRAAVTFSTMRSSA